MTDIIAGLAALAIIVLLVALTIYGVAYCAGSGWSAGVGA